MKYKIEIELDEGDIMQFLRKYIYNYLEKYPNIPKKATIKTFDEGKPIFSNIEIKRK